jgi:hypothetical protein
MHQSIKKVKGLMIQGKNKGSNAQIMGDGRDMTPLLICPCINVTLRTNLACGDSIVTSLHDTPSLHHMSSSIHMRGIKAHLITMASTYGMLLMFDIRNISCIPFYSCSVKSHTSSKIPHLIMGTMVDLLPLTVIIISMPPICAMI